MSLHDANQFLRLVNEFPGAETIEWRIDELFQRDVNWQRVEQQIVPYLRNPAIPQFFNSLTIALLPIREGKIKGFDGDVWNAPPLMGEEFAKIVKCGPISIGYYHNWTSVDEPGARLGQICWNPEQVFSVALDGQHRLAAIKAYLKGMSIERQNLTQVPVLLVVLDSRVGYEVGEQNPPPTVDVLRRLFIDLNKHAVKVARSRIILLDDTDPLSLCLRQSIGEKIANGLAELDAAPPRLPLSLINWHEEKEAKFDEGPYLTSILALDWIVKRMLHIDPIEDFTDYDRIESELESLSQSLALQLDDPESSTSQRLENCEHSDWAFSFVPEELNQITNAFSRVWVPAMLHILTDFRPYEDLITARRDNHSLSVEFINWYYLKVQSDKAGGGNAKEYFQQFVRQIQFRPENPIAPHVFEDALKDIDERKGDSLAFKVVFQRSLFLAFLDFNKITPEQVEELAEEPAKTANDILDETPNVEDAGEESTEIDVKAAVTIDRAKRFIEALNTLVNAAPSFLDMRCEISEGKRKHLMWNGTLYDAASGNINFTGAAARRGQEPMLWAAILSLLKQQSHSSVALGFPKFWDYLAEEDLPAVHKRLRRSLERFADDAAQQILRASRPDFGDLTEDELEKEKDRECKVRFGWIWQKVVR